MPGLKGRTVPNKEMDICSDIVVFGNQVVVEGVFCEMKILSPNGKVWNPRLQCGIFPQKSER